MRDIGKILPVEIVIMSFMLLIPIMADQASAVDIHVDAVHGSDHGNDNGKAIVDMGACEYMPTSPPIANANGPYEATTYQVLVDISPDPLHIEGEGKLITARPSLS